MYRFWKFHPLLYTTNFHPYILRSVQLIQICAHPSNMYSKCSKSTLVALKMSKHYECNRHMKLHRLLEHDHVLFHMIETSAKRWRLEMKSPRPKRVCCWSVMDLRVEFSRRYTYISFKLTSHVVFPLMPPPPCSRTPPGRHTCIRNIRPVYIGKCFV